MTPFSRLKSGLAKTRRSLVDKMSELFVGREDYTPEVFESLEELLIEADLGVDLSLDLAGTVEKRLRDHRVSGDDMDGVLDVMREFLAQEMSGWDAPAATEPEPGQPRVILCVGVNGVGKTTSVAKLAHAYQREGKRVLLAAADTFRAAAIDQLAIWADRLGCELVRHQDGADPSAVIHDALDAALARGVDVVIVDTAGRLHNKQHLMEELAKMRRVTAKAVPGAPHEVLLVLDANTGQNAVQQARLFKEVTDVTGVLLAKLDGTARGGVILAIGRELGIPVRYVGVGETLEDLEVFDPEAFAAALLAVE
jgi:fused signal recognition particle receptor